MNEFNIGHEFYTSTMVIRPDGEELVIAAVAVSGGWCRQGRWPAAVCGGWRQNPARNRAKQRRGKQSNPRGEKGRRR